MVFRVPCLQWRWGSGLAGVSGLAAGFTIVELLMVILLVGIMSAVAIPQFVDFGAAARVTLTRDKLIAFKMAIVGDSRAIQNGQYMQPGFENHIGSLPVTLNDLRVQGAHPNYDPFTKRGWRGPYILTSDTQWNLDSWGTVIQYNAGTRVLTSCGPNLTCGNADDISLQF